MEIYRQAGTAQRLDIPLKDKLPIMAVRVILRQAGLTAQQIETFLTDCTH